MIEITMRHSSVLALSARYVLILADSAACVSFAVCDAPRSGPQISANDSPVFRRDFQWAGRCHRLWSRRNSGPLDETGRLDPVCGVPSKAILLSGTRLGELYPA